MAPMQLSLPKRTSRHAAFRPEIRFHFTICSAGFYSIPAMTVAIAEHVAGSVEAFADMMNAEAASLRATNSHFVNPHGLQDDNHYTTA